MWKGRSKPLGSKKVLPTTVVNRKGSHSRNTHMTGNSKGKRRAGH
jgi:hypothetical protein